VIAGPVLHHREMMPQFALASTYRFNYENMAVGSTIFFIGLFKKVIVADGEIAFPYAERPQILICMSQEGFENNRGALVPGGMLIWDTDLVETRDLDASWVCHEIPATRFAEELGNKMMANIVMLGFFSALSDMVSTEALRKAMLGSVPPATKAKNEAAFERGRDYGLAILKSRAKSGPAQP